MKRVLAGLVAVTLFAESFMIPLAHAASLPPISPPVSLTSSARSLSSIGTVLPRSLGRVVEEFRGVSPRTVVHIQDVHESIPAQINLSAIIRSLHERAQRAGKILVVAVEGSVGDLDSDSIARLPNQQAKDEVGAGLLRAGYLLGEEYAAITEQPGQIKIIGVEQPNLYKRNGQAKAESRVAREKVLAGLKKSERQLKLLTPHLFNTTLSVLVDKRSAVSDGSYSLMDYLAFLNSVRPAVMKRYPHLSGLLSLNASSRGFNQAALRTEIERLISQLSLGDKQEGDAVLALTQDLKAGKISARVYYSDLLKRSTQPCPNLTAYVASLLQLEVAESDAVLDEMDRAEEEIASSLATHPLSAELYSSLSSLSRLEKFFSLSLIPQEWNRLRDTSLGDFRRSESDLRRFWATQSADLGFSKDLSNISESDFTAAFNGAHAFYTAVEERDHAMVQNLEKILQHYPTSQAEVAFIAGGFHTPGVTARLRALGLSYEVVRPQLDTTVHLSETYKFPHKQTYRQPGGLTNAPAIEAAIKNPAVLPKDRSGSKGVVTSLFLLGSLAIAAAGQGPGVEPVKNSTEIIWAFVVTIALIATVYALVAIPRMIEAQKMRRKTESMKVISGMSASGILSIEKLTALQSYAAAKDLSLIFTEEPPHGLFGSVRGIQKKYGSLLVWAGHIDKRETSEFDLSEIYPGIRAWEKSDFNQPTHLLTRDEYIKNVSGEKDERGFRISRDEAGRVYDWLVLKDEAEVRGISPHKINSERLDEIYLKQLNEKLYDPQFQLDFLSMAEQRLAASFTEDEVDPQKMQEVMSQRAELALLLSKYGTNVRELNLLSAKERQKVLVDGLKVLMNDRDFPWFLKRQFPGIFALARAEVDSRILTMISEGNFSDLNNAYVSRVINRAFLEAVFAGAVKKTMIFFLNDALPLTAQNLAKLQFDSAMRARTAAELPWALDLWMKRANDFSKLAEDRVEAAAKIKTLIEFMSGVPKELLDDSVEPYVPPKQEVVMTGSKFAQARKDSPWMVYSGQIPSRMFAGGNNRRLNVDKPAALLTPRDAYNYEIKNGNDKAQLPAFPDIPVLGRFILQIKASVTEIAQNHGWDIQAGLANQTIVIPTNEASAGALRQHLVDMKFYGMPPQVFVFLEQASGPGFDFSAGKFVRSFAHKELAEKGAYGHGEIEFRHNLPYEAYRIDESNHKFFMAAPFHRFLASQDAIFGHNQLSLEDVLTPGWIHNADRMAVGVAAVRSGLAGSAEFRLDETGTKGGMTGSSNGFPAVVAQFFGKNQGVVIFEQSQINTPEGVALRKKHQSLTANAAVVMVSARALEKVVNAANFPLIATLRGGKDNTPLVTIHPDTFSYWYYNLLNFQFFTPPNFRRELKEKKHFPLFLEDAANQDSLVSNFNYYAYATEIQNRIQPGSVPIISLPENGVLKYSSSVMKKPVGGYAALITLALFGMTLPALPAQMGSIEPTAAAAAAIIAGLLFLFAKNIFSRIQAFSSSTQSGRSSFFSSAIWRTTSAASDQVRVLSKKLRSLINNPIFTRDAKGFSAVVVDLDSFVEATENPDDISKRVEETIRIVLGLHKQKESNLMRSHIYFISKRLEFPDLVDHLSNLRVDGLTFEYRGPQMMNNWNGDVVELLRSSGLQYLSSDNTFVMSASQESWSGARFVPVFNLPHLSLAMFAYSHYRDAGAVLNELVALFEKFFKVEIRSRELSRSIQAEILGRIAA